MKISFCFLFGALAFLAVLPSCSLPSLNGLTIASPLKAGVRYEVRRAVSSTSEFEPWELRSVYFVLKPEAPPMIAGTRSSSNGVLSVRTTAYCHSEADHLPFGRLSASGKPLRYGLIRSAAADWSRFPLGTQFRIKSQPGVIYEVDDYGSALVGSNTIDLYCPTRRTMNNWGVRNCDIEVLHWGSFTASLETMKARVHFPHVRQMMRDIAVRMGGGGGRSLAQADSSFSITTPATASAAPATLLALGTSPSL